MVHPKGARHTGKQLPESNEITEVDAQHGVLQIKAMFLEITEHLFDPHPSSIIAQGQGGIGQVGGQTPGLFFTDLPVDQAETG